MVFTRDFLGLGLGLDTRHHSRHTDLNDSMGTNESGASQLFFALTKGRYMEGSGDSQWPTESLFPVNGNTANGDAPGSSGRYPTQNGGQLTIFYAGNINVFDNVPVDKAQAIMSWATNGSTPPLCSSEPLQHSRNAEHMLFEGQACRNPYTAADRVIEIPQWHLQFPIQDSSACSEASPLLMVPRALPQARKASLARFLERRKERMQIMCPYFKRNPAQGQRPTTHHQQLDESNCPPIWACNFMPNMCL